MNQLLTDLCKKLEHYETPEWAAKAILKKEVLTRRVVDPCVGAGILAETAKAAGYDVTAADIQDWGYPDTKVCDFLTTGKWLQIEGNTVFMNPPFSKAVEFVERSIECGARKIVCFQRFAWWESRDRLAFWQKNPPNRIYICSDRADCWRHDIPVNEKGKRYDPATGKEFSNSSTAHAWFIWEPQHPGGTLLGHISKADGK